MNALLQSPARRAQQAFVAAFDRLPTVLARAPGRVNLIGEHTDYNDGFVLPCAIDSHTAVALRPRDDAVVRVVAADLQHAVDEFRLDAPLQRNPRKPWADYVRGVFWALAERGLPLRGAQIAVAGDVPRGAGLSSSASLEVALALALQQAFGLDLSATELAQLSQRAENDFVGCPCGIMDQLVSARGQAGHALLIDCRSLALQPVPLPDELAVMIVHSNVRRGLVASAYGERRRQCQTAATALGVVALRDAEAGSLDAAAGRALQQADPVAWRRARHVITENARTQAAADALRDGRLAELGRLMAASHASMRDDFEITVPAVDRLVQVLQQAIGSDGGARMTGGGFGGCAVALLPADRADAVANTVARDYRAPDGRPGTVFVTPAGAGAGVLPLADALASQP